MKHLPERLAAIVMAWFLALLLAACAPGSGGTGTGPTSVTFTAQTTSGTAGQPSTPAFFAGLAIDTGSIRLDTGCGTFGFEGSWWTDAQNVARVTGQWQRAGGAVQFAALELAFATAPFDSPYVTVTLRDLEGAVLFGPILLQRGELLLSGSPLSCP